MKFYMLKQITILIAAIGILSLPAQAQSSNGSQYYTTSPTGFQSGEAAPPNNSDASMGTTFAPQSQTLNAGGVNGPMLTPAQTAQYGTAPGVSTPLNSLPTTEFSSLIFNPPAFDDEGTNGLPPDNGYGPQYSIGGPGESSIPAGLSTGHYDSSLPAVSSDQQYMLQQTGTSSATISP